MKPSILLVYISLILFSLACKLLTPVTASLPPTATQTEPSSIPTQIEKKHSSPPAHLPRNLRQPPALPPPPIQPLISVRPAKPSKTSPTALLMEWN